MHCPAPEAKNSAAFFSALCTPNSTNNDEEARGHSALVRPVIAIRVSSEQRYKEIAILETLKNLANEEGPPEPVEPRPSILTGRHKYGNEIREIWPQCNCSIIGLGTLVEVEIHWTPVSRENTRRRKKREALSKGMYSRHLSVLTEAGNRMIHPPARQGGLN